MVAAKKQNRNTKKSLELEAHHIKHQIPKSDQYEHN